MKRALVLVCCLVAGNVAPGCSGTPASETKSPQQQQQDAAAAAAAVTALQNSKFEDATREASLVLRRDPKNSRAAAVRAIARYQAGGHEFITELTKILDQSSALKLLDHEASRAVWGNFLADLEAVDEDLAIAGADRDFSLEICLACWERDWNRSGEIDDRDRKLFQIERDHKGEELPEGDPRRKPTFRLDVGDVEWARAMIHFQRAAIEIVLAYKWTELDKLFAMFGGGGGNDTKITIHLAEAARVKRARDLVIAGLGFADKCRLSYLAETDDDREWVPSPKQKSFAVPLPVDDALYANWAAIIGDVRRMLKSEEGISFKEVGGLAEADDDDLTRLPDAYLDLGAMLGEPEDIVFDVADVMKGRPDAKAVEKIVRGLIGNGYKEKMKPTPLVGRLRQMKAELSRGSDTFDRKLQYLLWLN